MKVHEDSRSTGGEAKARQDSQLGLQYSSKSPPGFGGVGLGQETWNFDRPGLLDGGPRLLNQVKKVGKLSCKSCHEGRISPSLYPQPLLSADMTAQKELLLTVVQRP